MNVLDDDKFGVGFEFEFVVADADLLHPRKCYERVSCLDWHKFKHGFELYAADHRMAWVEAVLSIYGHRSLKTRWDGDIEEYGKKFGWGRLIALLGLQPRNRKWYIKNRYDDLLDRTSVIEEAMRSLDFLDNTAIDILARRLGRYYIEVAPTESYGIEYDESHEIRKIIAERISSATGHRFRCLSYDNEHRTKDNPDWYLTMEFLDDSRESGIDESIELTTPVMEPREAIRECENIMETVDAMPWNIIVGQTCGLHINISHKDIGVEDISVLEYGLLCDEEELSRPFHRVRNENCLPYRKEIVKVVRSLVRNNIVSLSSFKRDPQAVIELIEASVDISKTASMNVGNMKDYGYLEYRMAGGKGYLKRTNEVRDLIIKLLKIHRKFGTRKKSVEREVRKILVSCDAARNDGLALMDTRPHSLFKV